MDLKSSVEQINVLVVIDTDYIMENYKSPSKDPNKPTGMNHNSQYMICHDPRGIAGGQGTADLNFNAIVGDLVSFTGTSIYANSDSAVIVYGIKYWQGDNVFGTFVPNLITRNRAVMPDPHQPTGLPPIQQAISFASFDSRINSGGTEKFYVYIAVYKLANDGQTQELYGYFYWDPTVTVPK
jgi:nematocidal protein AidA